MSKQQPTPRRVRRERNIYQRPTGVFEVGYKDASGTQRWRTVDGGIQAARALRDELLAGRRRGERTAPNVRLRFDEAAENWLSGPVAALRPATQTGYSNSIKRHLNPRFKTRRLDSITVDDVADLVRDLRSEGLAESSIVSVLGALNRVFKFAARRLGWAGQNPTGLLLTGERPKPSTAPRRPIFEGQELEQTIAAAHEPFKTLFTVAAVTGARVSEICGLRWEDVRLDDPEDAEIEFAFQLDRQGNRTPGKTDGSARTVPIPTGLALLLMAHNLRSPHSAPNAPVFGTRTGRPISQRNISRALRGAMRKAIKANGEPTFPALRLKDEYGQRVPPPRGSLPSFHSFRHTWASRAFLAGESIDEAAFLLGHKDANVTRAVYVHAIADGRRRALRRSRMLEEYGSLLEASDTRNGPKRPGGGWEVRNLQG